MSKLILLAATILMSSVSFAADPQIKITSFTYSSNDNVNNHVAELCGSVTDMATNPTFVQVVVDQSSKRPGNYNTVVGADGKFCVTLTNYNGTAIATLLK